MLGESESCSVVSTLCVLSPVRLFATPMDCSPPGSSVHGILRARTLEWVAISSSRGPSRPRDWTQVSCITGGFFYHGATREPQGRGMSYLITKERTRKYNFWAFYYEKHFVRDTYTHIHHFVFIITSGKLGVFFFTEIKIKRVYWDPL